MTLGTVSFLSITLVVCLSNPSRSHRQFDIRAPTYIQVTNWTWSASVRHTIMYVPRHCAAFPRKKGRLATNTSLLLAAELCQS